jgi:hypothetical protein
LKILGISNPPDPDIYVVEKSMVYGSGSDSESVIIRRTVSAMFTASWGAADLTLPLHNQLIEDNQNIITV